MTLPEPIENFISRLTPHPPRIYNLGGSATALFLALKEGPFLMVDSDEESAQRLLRDVRFYKGVVAQSEGAAPLPGGAVPLFLPAPDSPSASGQRAEVVRRLFLEGGRESVITYREALHDGLWPPEELRDNIVHLKASEETDRPYIEESLIRAGYMPVPLVTEKGQYSMRRWILDVFPSTYENPVRVEFFGDVAESIRTFDTSGQRSVSEIRECLIMPAKDPQEGRSLTGLFRGFEFFCSETVIEGMPDGTRALSGFAIGGEGVDAGLMPISGHGILPEEREDVYGLAAAIGKLSAANRVILISSSAGQAERLKEILRDSGVIAPLVDIKEAFLYEGRVSISVGDLSSGIFLPGLLILTEGEIFRKPPYRAMKKSRVSELIASLDDLSIEDYVVHKDYGIGRFMGLVRQSMEGYECDLMVIEYAGGDRLYLSLQGIGKVSKYHSEEGVLPKVDRLGSRSSWHRTKEKARKRIKEMAGRLIKLYAEREVSKGFIFSGDTELHREFDSFFLYEETPDQARAIEEIKKDMTSDAPMDRLLCGDVGYGKTEVAMRAAFRAVYDGRQAAVIVPTTLLCDQHLRTFKSRFSAFPIKIDYISRFKPKKEQLMTVKAVNQGGIDIIIGTQALFKKDILFPDLGLLIIDEEHRFGVAQKERLKELKKGVDVLSLSATPIPRTLQMSLSGIRQMSIIETPPEERLAVKTMVSAFNDDVIVEALSRETERGGQVFFVHNRIGDIMKVADYIRRLMPHLRIAVAHGRMPERELERIMLRFLGAEVDVLVSTAIIGSGLDISNANTIIVDMADRMGLADLYQLRGRVGRGNVKAYAYFLISGGGAVTEEARKRLQAIQELSYLGAGLRLAMKDLEIRGAGNLLGPEQSGYIHAVGFDMYIEMLEEAVSELKGMEVKEKAEARISLTTNAFIPEDYIEDMMLRLTAYRRIASAESANALGAIEAEMRDRFGPPPAEFHCLLKVMEMKLLALRLSIAAISQTGDRVRFVFLPGAEASPHGILRGFKNRVRFFKDGFEIHAREDIFSEVRGALEIIAGSKETLPSA
ncbi:MAG: transcription-repair coupling factor [Thermodesulfovibrionales bacterium]|nr:transcription-repair coupling factor [Thermodesulfovibrionales bacterium]